MPLRRNVGELDSAMDLVIREFTAGHYSARIRMDDPDPAARRTADSINRLLDTIDVTISRKNNDISNQTAFLLLF